MSESSNGNGLEQVFGMWADRNVDGLEYQLRIRSEWDEREKDIEDAFARMRNTAIISGEDQVTKCPLSEDLREDRNTGATSTSEQ